MVMINNKKNIIHLAFYHLIFVEAACPPHWISVLFYIQYTKNNKCSVTGVYYTFLVTFSVPACAWHHITSGKV